MRRWMPWCVALSAVLVPSAAHAQDPAPPDTVEAEPIEVWYTQEKSQARRAESIAVFTASEMRHDDEISPYEFFKTVNGVNLVQGHALGYGLRNPVAGRLQIRGIGRKAGPTDFTVRGVLLLMDGVPDFSVTHGHPLPDMFSRSYVDEIEVIKGPSSVRYGWGQAGVILMRSREPSERGSSGYLGVSAGAYGTTQDILEYNHRWSDGFVQLSGAFRRTDGHRPSSETEAHDGRVRIGQRVADGVRLIASVRGGHNDWEIPGPVGGEPGVGGENDWYVADVGTRIDAAGWGVTGKWWRFDADVSFEDGLLEPNEAWGIRTKADREAWDGGELTLGLDYLSYRVGRGRDEVEFSPTRGEIAPYAWVRHEADRWIASGGLRYTNNEQFGDDVSPEAGLVFLPAPATSIRAHVSHGFRAPTPFEAAFGSSANPDLEATDLWQYELGWNQRAADDRLELDLVGWVQDGSNMITTAFDPVVQDERNVNTGAFTHRGIEARVEYADPLGWRVGLAGTTMDLEDDTALVPQKTVDVWLGYQPGRWGVRLDGRWAGDRFQRDDEELALDDYFVADLRAWYRFASGMGLRLEVENVTDEEYELFQGWPMPGAALHLGADWVY